MRVKKDGKLRNAATVLAYKAARPMFFFGSSGTWRIGPAQNMIPDGWTAFGPDTIAVEESARFGDAKC
jgi:hypothetical protein